MHHYSITQTSFTALKTLCALPAYYHTPPAQPLATTDLVPTPLLHLFDTMWSESQYLTSGFQMGSIHLVICTYRPSMCFGSIVRFFLFIYILKIHYSLN